MYHHFLYTFIGVFIEFIIIIIIRPELKTSEEL